MGRQEHSSLEHDLGDIRFGCVYINKDTGVNGCSCQRRCYLITAFSKAAEGEKERTLADHPLRGQVLDIQYLAQSF